MRPRCDRDKARAPLAGKPNAARCERWPGAQNDVRIENLGALVKLGARHLVDVRLVEHVHTKLLRDLDRSPDGLGDSKHLRGLRQVVE